MITYLHEEVLVMITGGTAPSNYKNKAGSKSVFIGNFATQSGLNEVQSVVGGLATKGGTIYACTSITQINNTCVASVAPA